MTGVVPKLRDRVTRSRRSCGADIQMGKVAGKVAGALSHFLAGYVWAGATFRWYDRDAFDATSPVLQQLHMQPSFISGLTPRRRQREELAPLASYWSVCSCRALALPCLCCVRNCAYRGVLWGVLWGPHQSTKVLYAHHNGRGGGGPCGPPVSMVKPPYYNDLLTCVIRVQSQCCVNQASTGACRTTSLPPNVLNLPLPF